MIETISIKMVLNHYYETRKKFYILECFTCLLRKPKKKKKKKEDIVFNGSACFEKENGTLYLSHVNSV